MHPCTPLATHANPTRTTVCTPHLPHRNARLSSALDRANQSLSDQEERVSVLTDEVTELKANLRKMRDERYADVVKVHGEWARTHMVYDTKALPVEAVGVLLEDIDGRRAELLYVAQKLEDWHAGLTSVYYTGLQQKRLRSGVRRLEGDDTRSSRGGRDGSSAGGSVSGTPSITSYTAEIKRRSDALVNRLRGECLTLTHDELTVLSGGHLSRCRGDTSSFLAAYKQIKQIVQTAGGVERDAGFWVRDDIAPRFEKVLLQKLDASQKLRLTEVTRELVLCYDSNPRSTQSMHGRILEELSVNLHSLVTALRVASPSHQPPPPTPSSHASSTPLRTPTSSAHTPLSARGSPFPVSLHDSRLSTPPPPPHAAAAAPVPTGRTARSPMSAYSAGRTRPGSAGPPLHRSSSYTNPRGTPQPPASTAAAAAAAATAATTTTAHSPDMTVVRIGAHPRISRSVSPFKRVNTYSGGGGGGGGAPPPAAGGTRGAYGIGRRVPSQGTLRRVGPASSATTAAAAAAANGGSPSPASHLNASSSSLGSGLSASMSSIPPPPPPAAAAAQLSASSLPTAVSRRDPAGPGVSLSSLTAVGSAGRGAATRREPGAFAAPPRGAATAASKVLPPPAFSPAATTGAAAVDAPSASAAEHGGGDVASDDEAASPSHYVSHPPPRPARGAVAQAHPSPAPPPASLSPRGSSSGGSPVPPASGAVSSPTTSSPGASSDAAVPASSPPAPQHQSPKRLPDAKQPPTPVADFESVDDMSPRPAVTPVAVEVAAAAAAPLSLGGGRTVRISASPGAGKASFDDSFAPVGGPGFYDDEGFGGSGFLDEAQRREVKVSLLFFFICVLLFCLCLWPPLLPFPEQDRAMGNYRSMGQEAADAPADRSAMMQELLSFSGQLESKLQKRKDPERDDGIDEAWSEDEEDVETCEDDDEDHDGAPRVRYGWSPGSGREVCVCPAPALVFISRPAQEEFEEVFDINHPDYTDPSLAAGRSILRTSGVSTPVDAMSDTAADATEKRNVKFAEGT